MTNEEQASFVGEDFMALRAAERRLVCLRGKAANLARTLKRAAAALEGDGNGFLVRGDGGTLGFKASARHAMIEDQVHFPDIGELTTLMQDAHETEREIAERKGRLDRL